MQSWPPTGFRRARHGPGGHEDTLAFMFTSLFGDFTPFGFRSQLCLKSRFHTYSHRCDSLVASYLRHTV